MSTTSRNATTVSPPDLIKLQDEEKEDNELFTDESVLSVLECPVCMEYMLPPIAMCKNGHSICDQCKTQLPLCPTCRKPFLENTRNVALESIASGLDYPCRNEGCMEIFPLKLILEHQAVCLHRPRECPLSAPSHCSWKGPSSLLMKHVMDAHRRYVRVGSESCSVLNDVSNTPGYTLIVYAFDQMFLQRSRLQDCKFFSAVQYCGPKENASKYRFEFELCSAKGHFKVIVGCLTHSDAEDLQTINKAGKCVRLDYDVIKRYMYDDKLPYKLRIYQVENYVL